MKETVKFKDIRKMSSFKAFSSYSLNLLLETMSSFFGCKVDAYFNPRKEFLDQFGIDILGNVHRGYYPLNENTVLIVGRILRENQMMSAIGFRLEGVDSKRDSKLLNLFERSLTRHLSDELPHFFENSSLIFGDEIIKNLISVYVAKGGYDSRQIRHLLEYFFKLRTTSFEGQYFSTGAIFTKSSDTFDGTFDGKRFGISRKLKNQFSINNTNKIDKRIWYLIDGRTSFLLGDKNLFFRNLFTLNEGYAKKNFLDSYSLSLTLKGGDFLIKIENEKLLSLITSNGSEFLFFENKWKYRNYSVLKELISKYISADESIINSILFYILTFSKRQISSILWFPNDIDDLDQYIIPSTKNNFLLENLNITENQSINHLFRCLSSDGVSIIDKLGELRYIGVIVDISKAQVKGIAGTGESAASVLSKNGVSIKISQDGLIKIFVSEMDRPFYF